MFQFSFTEWHIKKGKMFKKEKKLTEIKISNIN